MAQIDKTSCHQLFSTNLELVSDEELACIQWSSLVDMVHLSCHQLSV